MNILPDQLESSGFRQLDSLDHKELVPFIRNYLGKRTRTKYLYIMLNLLFLLTALFLFFHSVKSEGLSFATSFGWLAYGFASTLLLIPIHECIHALAYRMMGAKHTSFDANIRKFYFLAMADQFVSSRREFQFVALAPFVLISLLLLFAMMIVPVNWQLMISGVLFMHTACCSGDFGMLCYFEVHREKELVTYDDRKAGQTYFFAR